MNYYPIERYYRVHQKLSKRVNTKAFEKRFDDDLVKVHKELFPKKRKVQYYKIPEERVRELRGKYIPQVERIINRRENQAKVLFDNLESLVDPSSIKILPDGEWKVVRSSSTHMYNTQTNSHGYAKGYLYPYQDALEERGFKTKIEYREEFRGTRTDGSTYDGGTYSLLSNCTEAVAWWVYYTSDIDPQKSVEKRALNYRVYNPFLPY